MRLHVRTYMRIHTCVYMVYVSHIHCVYIYVYTYTHACIYTCICVHIYACMHVYMYTCIDIHTHACIHVYVYTYTHACIHISFGDIRYVPTRSKFALFQGFLNFSFNAPKFRSVGGGGGGVCVYFLKFVRKGGFRNVWVGGDR